MVAVAERKNKKRNKKKKDRKSSIKRERIHFVVHPLLQKVKTSTPS